MRLSFCAALAAVLWLVAAPVPAEPLPPPVGGLLPDIELAVPSDTGHREYLGLSEEGTFAIPEIKATVVIIEIFSMYCPHCQREAPVLNQMFSNIENNPDLKGKVKMIGIGAGNSAFEINFFRKTYKVPFPLFPDKDFKLHKLLGEVRTPYFIGVRIKEGGSHTVFYSKLGGAKSARILLGDLLHQSGLPYGRNASGTPGKEMKP